MTGTTSDHATTGSSGSRGTPSDRLTTPAAPVASASTAVTVLPIATPSATLSGQPLRVNGPFKVVMARYIVSPGAVLPPHLHPHPRLGVMEKGCLEVINHETGQAQSFCEGAVIAEVINTVHHGRNVGQEPAQLMVLDIVPVAESGNTVLANQPGR